MALMNTVPLLENVRLSTFYTSAVGVAPGVATGFEAHAWVLWDGITNALNNVVDAGLVANGDGTDGWGLSMDYVVATGVTTFSATFGDTGGAAVKITSGSMLGVMGRYVLVSAFCAADGAIALAVNGDIVVASTLVGTYSPAAGERLDVGAANFGFSPILDLHFGGVAYNDAAFANLAATRTLAAQRYQALTQTMRMFRFVAFNVGTNTVEPLEYTNAWDGTSLMQSGPTTASATDRNLPAETWLPRSGTDNLVLEGEGTTTANLLGYEVGSTPWALGA